MPRLLPRPLRLAKVLQRKRPLAKTQSLAATPWPLATVRPLAKTQTLATTLTELNQRPAGDADTVFFHPVRFAQCADGTPRRLQCGSYERRPCNKSISVPRGPTTML